MRLRRASVLFAAVMAAAVEAWGDRVAPVTDPAVQQECGSCHMVFPPQFLPQRSWRRLMETLEDHFGDNASLGEEPRQAILTYLLAHAADGPQTGRQGRKFTQGLSPGQTPLRITETPRWQREHRKVPSARWTSPEVKSKANCLACHPRAAQGLYEDE